MYLQVYAVSRNPSKQDHLPSPIHNAPTPYSSRSDGWYREMDGQIFAAARTTRRVPMPPLTTEMTGEKSCATRPDSKPPTSLEALIKTLFTALTRPRMALGVR